jgi:hypothetical protein
MPSNVGGEFDFTMFSQDVRVLTSALENFTQRLEESSSHGQTQTIIHTQAGPSGLLWAAITACFLTYAALIIFAVWTIGDRKEQRDDLRDVKAWNEVLRQKVAKIEAANHQEKAP